MNGHLFLNLKDLYIKSYRFLSLPPEFSFLSPADENQPLEVQCAVVNVPVRNGLISSRKKIAAESSILNLSVDGDINLADEKPALKLEASPHSDGVLKSMFSSADIEGSLMKPQIRLNAGKVIDKVLSLGMAFIMGGREAAKEMVQQQKLQNVCATALEEEK